MDGLLDKLDVQINELVSRISQLEKLDDQPAKIAKLDAEFVDQLSLIKQQLDTSKELHKLREEGNTLDNSINSILIELAKCRHDLEQLPIDRTHLKNRKVDADDLLDYATKITKFTKQMPGNAEGNLLPWPAEDQLRRGMLATLTIQEEQGTTEVPAEPVPVQEPEQDHMDVETSQPIPQQPKKQSRPKAPKQKISLDFDSDED